MKKLISLLTATAIASSSIAPSYAAVIAKSGATYKDQIAYWTANPDSYRGLTVKEWMHGDKRALVLNGSHIFGNLLPIGMPIPAVSDLKKLSEVAKKKESVLVSFKLSKDGIVNANTGNEVITSVPAVVCEVADQAGIPCADLFTMILAGNTELSKEQIRESLMNSTAQIKELAMLDPEMGPKLKALEFVSDPAVKAQLENALMDIDKLNAEVNKLKNTDLPAEYQKGYNAGVQWAADNDSSLFSQADIDNAKKMYVNQINKVASEAGLSGDLTISSDISAVNVKIASIKQAGWAKGIQDVHTKMGQVYNNPMEGPGHPFTMNGLNFTAPNHITATVSNGVLTIKGHVNSAINGTYYTSQGGSYQTTIGGVQYSVASAADIASVYTAGTMNGINAGKIQGTLDAKGAVESAVAGQSVTVNGQSITLPTGSNAFAYVDEAAGLATRTGQNQVELATGIPAISNFHSLGSSIVAGQPVDIMRAGTKVGEVTFTSGHSDYSKYRAILTNGQVITQYHNGTAWDDLNLPGTFQITNQDLWDATSETRFQVETAGDWQAPITHTASFKNDITVSRGGIEVGTVDLIPGSVNSHLPAGTIITVQNNNRVTAVGNGFYWNGSGWQTEYYDHAIIPNTGMSAIVNAGADGIISWGQSTGFSGSDMTRTWVGDKDPQSISGVNMNESVNYSYGSFNKTLSVDLVTVSVNAAIVMGLDTLEDALEEAYNSGWEDGYSEGYEDGWNDGYSAGFSDGRK